MLYSVIKVSLMNIVWKGLILFEIFESLTLVINLQIIKSSNFQIIESLNL